MGYISNYGHWTRVLCKCVKAIIGPASSRGKRDITSALLRWTHLNWVYWVSGAERHTRAKCLSKVPDQWMKNIGSTRPGQIATDYANGWRPRSKYSNMGWVGCVCPFCLPSEAFWVLSELLGPMLSFRSQSGLLWLALQGMSNLATAVKFFPILQGYGVAKTLSRSTLPRSCSLKAALCKALPNLFPPMWPS